MDYICIAVAVPNGIVNCTNTTFQFQINYLYAYSLEFAIILFIIYA